MKDYDYSEATALMEKYPYFIVPAVRALTTATGEERRTLLRRIAAAVCSEADLRAIAGIDPEEFAAFYPDSRHSDAGTEATIDSFLEKFSTPERSAAPEVENIVAAAPVSDYAAAMLNDDDEDEEDLPHDSTSSAIDSFLSAVPPKKPRKREAPKTHAEEEPEAHEAAPHKPEEHDTLSESLARMMVKNGNYRKALEIISDLSLKNPKKSIYFADQMRFLKKLIQNQEKSGR